MLYEVVRDHLETFLSHAAESGDNAGIPRFVEREFRDFLRCGQLAAGFARLRCGACGTDRLLPLSCKRRTVCASCGGRRMAERAAHLVDHVFPDAPVRQWVLSLPHRLRYQLAWNHDLCRAVTALTMRAILKFLRDQARAADLADARSGAVVIVQRFGGSVNLNVHFHILALDGVFVPDGDTLRFRRLVSLEALDVADVLATIVPGVRRLLSRRGLGADADDTLDLWADTEPVLAGVAAASVQGRVALGPRAGQTLRRRGSPSGEPVDWAPGPCHARQDGFDLQAAVRIPAGHRDRLERVCKYALRPPVAADRLQLTADGQVLLELKRRWSDGTTHLVFDPLELLERLAAITPRPRINLVLYYGVLGARSAWRAKIVPRSTGDATSPAAAGSSRLSGSGWAALMRRSFGFDVLACPRCGGRLRLIAFIEHPVVIRRILNHLGLPTEIPEPRSARDPPRRADVLPADIPDVIPFDFGV